MVDINAKAGGLFSVLGGATNMLKGFAKDGEITADEMNAVGMKLGIGLGIAAAAVTVMSLKMATDFQSAMVRLQTDAGIPQSEIQGLGDQFLQLATKVGYTATQLATADWHVASSGFTDIASNMQVMTAAAEGARAGASDLETTTQALARTMVAYDIPASQATQTMNALIETTSLGDARLQDLAQALTNVLPAAAGAGIGLDQVLGAMSTMTAEGENAASAGTHLRAALLNIEGGTATAAAAMEKYGITASQVRAELSGGGGLTGALTLMENAVAKGTTGFTEYMAKLQAAGSDQQKFDDLISQVPANLAAPVGALESMTGGVRSFQSILELTGSHLQTFKDNVAKVGKSMHDAASEVQGFHTWANSTSGVVEQFKGAMSTLAVQVGNLLLPAFTAFMRVVAEGATWLTQHKDAAIALAAVLGTAMVGALILVTAALWGMAAALWANPVTWVVAAVVALVAALAALAYWIEKSHPGALGHAWGNVVHAWDNVVHAGANVVHAFVNIGHAIMNVVHAFVNIGHAIMNVVHAFTNVMHAVGNVIHALDNVGHAFMNVERFIQDIPLVALGLFIMAWRALWGLIQGPIMAVVHGIESAFSAVTQWLSAKWREIQSDAVGVWNAIWSFLSGLWSSIVADAQSIWNTMVSVASSAWHAVLSAIEALAGPIWNAIKTPVLNGLNAIRGLIGDFISIGHDLVMGMVHGVEAAAAALARAAANVVKSALNAARSALGISSPSKVFRDEVGKNISLGIAAGITEQGPAIGSALAAVTSRENLALASGHGTVNAWGGIGGNQFSGGASVAGGGQVFHLEVHGNIYGTNGMRDAAGELWQEFLRMQNRSPLGFRVA